MSQSSGPSGFDNPWLAATVGLVLLAIAIGFALGAGRLGTHLASRPSMEAARAQRSAVGQWPAVPATLQRLTLVKMRAGRGPGVIYVPRVEYRFSVGARTYSGNRLSPDDSWRRRYQAGSSDDFRHVVAMLAPGLDYQKFRDAPQCAGLGAYDECEVDFRIEQPLQVHYNPDNPAESAVDVDEASPVTLVDHLIAPVAWLVCLIFAMLASLQGAWGLFRRLLDADAQPAREGGSLRLLRWTGATLFAAVTLEAYTWTLAWRGMPGNVGEVLGFVPGVVLCAVAGLFSVYLLVQPAIDRKWRKPSRRQRR